MSFEMPRDFKKISSPNSPDFPFDFAVNHQSHKIEIRYNLIPAGNLDRLITDTGIISVAYSKTYAQSFFQAYLFSITDSIPVNITPIGTADVKKEFGADWGAFAVIKPRKSFADGYQNCIIVCIHKNNTAEGFISFLFDDINDVHDLVYGSDFHSLKFKP